MFGKENEAEVPMKQDDPNATSILAKGCRFKGEVEVQGTLRVEGEFEGTIRKPENLVVGKTGVVKGEIFAKNAVVGGRVDGNITADDKIELQSGSTLEGDIKTRRLVIDEGVVFEGSCSMGKRPVGSEEREIKSGPASTTPQPMGSGQKQKLTNS
ncbi:MAG TPA: polymer-forming cytoskeletal protein [Candidatus Krumholzibacteria bacterium]|nr:polymer-forming cytoskeletal protein [Candidatus Krumholzibacteria bacterium]